MKRELLVLSVAILLIAACTKSPDNTPPSQQSNTDPVVTNTPPIIQWQKSFGGSGDESANAIQQTKDGGYIIAGTSNSNNGDVSGNHGKEDFWVLKLNSAGSIEWQKSYGGSSSDYATSVKQTNDGGYIVSGQTFSKDGDITNNTSTIGGSFWVIKLSSAGALQWQECLALNTVGCGAADIQQTTEGGYVVVGNANYLMPTLSYGDVLVIKLGNAGNIEWTKALGGHYHDGAKAIQQTTDGGYIISGNTASSDGIFSVNHGSFTYDYYVVKITTVGDIQWQKVYGSSGNDDAKSVKQTADGGYIVAGDIEVNDGDVTGGHGGEEYWILKLDNNGNITWKKCYGGSGNEIAYAIQQTTDNGYVIAGTSQNSTDGDVTVSHGSYDFWIVKTDNPGVIQWQKSYGGQHDDYARSIIQTVDGGYIVAGQSNSVNGDVTGNHGNSDCWVVKLK
ncbi:autotransporter outer membrane beta-barrel domain-containing protein [Mucilaginibacter paludis]|uniref:Two component regulator propeller n=1 Tax=Mucilaginibacter paludis DSM 18603 TaxID=714943 RepID=H1YBZ7_9SPHI|nr:hypothetical protein [Mucilaginibacter paludis]EHQ27075.1 Two component regulator propeller [Mucilaginibacter paludis DSM 18603]